jgi:hypothetical protein
MGLAVLMAFVLPQKHDRRLSYFGKPGFSSSLRRVISASTPGVTTTDPLDRFPSAAHRSVFVDRVQRVLTACRCISAVATHEMPESHTVKQHELDK